MDALEHAINRGKEAQRVLEEPILAEAFAALEAAYTDEWKSSDYNAITQRENAFTRLSALAEVKRQIQAFVTDGKMAESRLKKAKL